MALFACVAICLWALRKLPDLEKNVPKYLYDSTISSLELPNVKSYLSFFQVPKIMT